jgi:ABC-type sugar transport system ATPase subunit
LSITTSSSKGTAALNASVQSVNAKPLARLLQITKRFGRVAVLDNVSFEIFAGEVHVLAGENGAGKSTLISILGGIHTDFEGTISIEGRNVRPRSPLEATTLGVAVIHQELSAIGAMSVADNIFLGRVPTTNGGFVRSRYQHELACRCLAPLGLDIDVDRAMEEYPIGTRQLIEIAKALNQNAKIIVMDEPTSALNTPEVERLFQLIAELKSRGCGVVYITHKMEEIGRIADRITVLRDGRLIGTSPASELPMPKLIEWMVGRGLQEQETRSITHPGDVTLATEEFSVYPRGFSAPPTVKEVSFSVCAGEVVGLAGLQGSGVSDLMWGLFGGYGSRTAGRVELEGRSACFRRPRQAIDAGVALLTNDRKSTGLILSLPIYANLTLPQLNRFSPYGWLQPTRERTATIQAAEAFDLRVADVTLEVSVLSGGNQQKVALAKWLQTKPKLLMLDEPTRGIDIGAKRQIYRLISHWAASGIAVLLTTSEMPELLTLSDRIVAMHRGRVTATLERHDATPDRVLAAAMGKSFQLASHVSHEQTG